MIWAYDTISNIQEDNNRNQEHKQKVEYANLRI